MGTSLPTHTSAVFSHGRGGLAEEVTTVPSQGLPRVELPHEKQLGVWWCLRFRVSVPVASGLGLPLRSLGWLVSQCLGHTPPLTWLKQQFEGVAWALGPGPLPSLKLAPEAGLRPSPLAPCCTQSCQELPQSRRSRTPEAARRHACRELCRLQRLRATGPCQ